MNEDNYQFLVRALGKLGFEDSLDSALRTKMQLNFPSFELKAKVNHGKDHMIHELSFDQKKTGGFYFLNSQNVTLVKENQEEVKQRFPFFNQKGFSNEQTYNLMNGRSVLNTVRIEGKEITRWTRIDFLSEKNDKDNFIFRNVKVDDLSFSLPKELGKLPIQGLDQDSKESLLRGLQIGNRETVLLRHEGQRERVYLEASPGTNSINVYNSQGERINLSTSKIQVIQEEKAKEVPDMTKKMMEKTANASLEKEQKRKIS